MILGDLAYCMVNNEPLNANKIVVGVRKLETDYSTLETIKSFMPGEIKHKGDKVEFTYEGIPVIVKIIKNDYSFITNPDTRFAEYWHWLVPNNFDKYWKMRHLVN